MKPSQISRCAAQAAVHESFVRRALSVAEPPAIGFVCDTDDALACELMTYAGPHKRVGAQLVDGVYVFALRFSDAMTLLRAPDHEGDRETQLRIIEALWRRGSVMPCICIAFGAVVLVDLAQVKVAS